MALILVKLTESALDILWTLSGIFGGGMCGLFLLGMISRRAKNVAAITGGCLRSVRYSLNVASKTDRLPTRTTGR